MVTLQYCLYVLVGCTLLTVSLPMPADVLACAAGDSLTSLLWLWLPTATCCLQARLLCRGSACCCAVRVSAQQLVPGVLLRVLLQLGLCSVWAGGGGLIDGCCCAANALCSLYICLDVGIVFGALNSTQHGTKAVLTAEVGWGFLHHDGCQLYCAAGKDSTRLLPCCCRL